MTKEEHDVMVSKFVDYLKKENMARYSIEFPIKLDDKNTGYADVVIFQYDKMFLFDMKSKSTDFSTDIQKVRRYVLALGNLPEHTWRDIYGFLVYDSSLRERVIRLRNLFRNVGVFFFDENNNVVDLHNRELKHLINKTTGKFPKLRMIAKKLMSDTSLGPRP